MLTTGHIALSYLLAKSASLFGVDFTSGEVFAIIAAGNFPDIDFITGLFTGKKGELHHQNITHTPIGLLIMVIVFALALRLHLILSVFLIISALFHLLWDDLPYFIFRMGLTKSKVNPQINWFYPFVKYKKNKLTTSNNEALKSYLTEARPVFVLEVILVIVFIVVILTSLA